MSVINKELFKLNLTKDLLNPTSAISIMKRITCGELTWLWARNTFTISELDLKITFNEGTIIFTDIDENWQRYWDLTISSMGPKQEFLIETLDVDVYSIHFGLKQCNLEIVDNRLEFKKLKFQKNYDYHFDTRYGISGRSMSPIYIGANTFSRQAYGRKQICSHCYFTEENRKNLLALRWSPKMKKSQRKEVEKLMEVCKSLTQDSWDANQLIMRRLQNIGKLDWFIEPKLKSK